MIFRILIMLAIFLASFSCQKKNEDFSSKNIELTNGMAELKNIAVLLIHYKEKNKQLPEKLELITADYPNLINIEWVYNSSSEHPIIIHSSQKIGGYFLLLNKEGEIKKTKTSKMGSEEEGQHACESKNGRGEGSERGQSVNCELTE